MEQTTYLCKFDSDGRRTETLLTCKFTDEEKQQKIADGYIEITEDEWSFYVGNKGQGKNGTGYIRGADGKPTSAPLYVPSADEKRQALVTQYEADKAEYLSQLTDALAHDDAETVAQIKDDIASLDETFAAEYAAIK